MVIECMLVGRRVASMNDNKEREFVVRMLQSDNMKWSKNACCGQTT